MALLNTMETFGFCSQFFGATCLLYFPFVPFDQQTFLDVIGRRHIIAGCLLLVTATVDYFTFYNYPMQRSIILARTERS